MLIKQYFTYVSTVQSILVNMFLGYILPPFILIGLHVPNIIALILIMVFVFIVGNFILYRICKRVRRIPLEFVEEKQWIKQGIKVVVICFLPIICLLILFLMLYLMFASSSFQFRMLPS